MPRGRRADPTQPQPVPGAGQAKGKPLSEKRRRELSKSLIKLLLKAVQNDRNPGKPLVCSACLQIDSVNATREELRPDTSFVKLLWSLVEGPSCPLEDEGGHFLLRPGQLWSLSAPSSSPRTSRRDGTLSSSMCASRRASNTCSQISDTPARRQALAPAPILPRHSASRCPWTRLSTRKTTRTMTAKRGG